MSTQGQDAMKVCTVCGESYLDYIDFCFQDGEVLTLQATAMDAPEPGLDAPPPPSRFQGKQSGATRTATPIPRAKRSLINRPQSASSAYSSPEDLPSAEAPPAPADDLGSPAPEDAPAAGAPFSTDQAFPPEPASSGAPQGLGTPAWASAAREPSDDLVPPGIRPDSGSAPQGGQRPSQVDTMPIPRPTKEQAAAMRAGDETVPFERPEPPRPIPVAATPKDRSAEDGGADEFEEGQSRSRVMWLVLPILAVGIVVVGLGVVAVGSMLAGGDAPAPLDVAPVPVPPPSPAPAPETAPPSEVAGADQVDPGDPGQVDPGAPAPVPALPAPGAPTGAPTVANVDVAEVAPATVGTLRLRSNPTGASAMIDGKAVGVTPLKLDLPPGPHTITLELAGHQPVSQTFQVAVGENDPPAWTLAKATSAPAPSPVPAPAPVAAPAPAPVAAPAAAPQPPTATGAKLPVMVFFSGRVGDELFVDNVAAGSLPARLELTAGPHVFEVRGAQGDFKVTRDVTASASGRTIIQLAQ